MFNRYPRFFSLCGDCSRSFVDSSAKDAGAWIVANLDPDSRPDFIMVWDRRVTLEPPTKRYSSLMKVLFLHGWQSVPGSVKPTYLKDHGHMVINPALPHEDSAEAVRIAQAEFDNHQPQVVVGSSRGCAVAMNFSSGDAMLVLLCPAWKKYGTARTVKAGSVILHSRADNVVPFADSEELVRNSGLPESALIEVGSDHRLAEQEPLRNLLEACDQSLEVRR